jgi:MFS transporter, ACS family, hexuronate transporter
MYTHHPLHLSGRVLPGLIHHPASQATTSSGQLTCELDRTNHILATPLAFSLAFLRALGYHCALVKKIRGLRWWMIGLIMLGSIVNYLTRSSLAVAAPTVLHDLHITETQYSWIVSAFQGTIMAQPIAGYLLDVLSLKTGLAIFVVAWALTNMAHGLAHSWQALAGLRGLLGFSEGSANPAGMKATAEWFPARERGLAGGVYTIGASFGSMLAPPLVAWAILAYNWRVAFVITGALGLVWVVLWLLFYQSPEKHAALTKEERKYIAGGRRNICKAMVRARRS